MTYVRKGSLTLTILASSSDANAAIVRSENTAILVDAGLGRNACFKAMAEAGVHIESLRCAFVSHGHGDHSRGIQQITSRLNIAAYCGPSTVQRLAGCPIVRTFQEELFEVGDIKCAAFSIPHDAPNYGFWFLHGGSTIAIATDLSSISKETASWLDADVILLESSYDADMLAVCSYEGPLRRRITGAGGHLSNEACGAFLSGLVDRPRTVVLGHISREANDVELVRELAKKALGGKAARLEVFAPDRKEPLTVSAMLATEVIGEAL